MIDMEDEMTQEELVEQVAMATARDKAAREASIKARTEEEEASKALHIAWTKLRDWQDDLVSAAMETNR